MTDVVAVDLEIIAPPAPPEAPKKEFPLTLVESPFEAERGKTFGAYDALLGNEEAWPILVNYSEALQRSDEAFTKVEQAFSQLEGAKLIPEIAKANFTRQTDLLLQAALEIASGKTSVVPAFGEYRILETFDQIAAQLSEISYDLGGTASWNKQYESLEEMWRELGDKYVFDANLSEKPSLYGIKVKVFDDPTKPSMATFFEKIGSPAGNETEAVQIEPLTHFSARIENNDEAPDIVVIAIPNRTSFQIDQNHDYYQQLYEEWADNFPDNQRPIVIMYTPGFEPPLHIKFDYEGFLFATDQDALVNTLMQARLFSLLRKKPEIFTPEGLSPLQQEQYDHSLDLHEWEHKTADTYRSLFLIMRRIFFRNGLLEEKFSGREDYSHFLELEGYELPYTDIEGTAKRLLPERQTRTILDLGTGDGRIAGPLARLGFKVAGLDISKEQLARGETRLVEEGQGLRGEIHRPGLSYPVLQKLNLPMPIITDDREAKANYQTVQGSFFNLHEVLNNMVTNWRAERPNAPDPWSFFGESKHNEAVFSDPFGTGDMFSDTGFDLVTANWHTLCEAGSPDNIADLLRQIMAVTQRGAELVIEIPDRTLEPYASRLKEYHDKHPEEPFGTLREVYEGKEYSPRYFPSKQEMIALLRMTGFEIDPQHDVHPYFITSKDQATEKEKMELKELVITARKPVF